MSCIHTVFVGVLVGKLHSCKVWFVHIPGVGGLPRLDAIFHSSFMCVDVCHLCYVLSFHRQLSTGKSWISHRIIDQFVYRWECMPFCFAIQSLRSILISLFCGYIFDLVTFYGRYLKRVVFASFD